MWGKGKIFLVVAKPSMAGKRWNQMKDGSYFTRADFMCGCNGL
jgi:hypothetical protein